eukprot:COSAG02_NODE_5306_length_4452_cov_2.519642_1_plen_78_part_00
MALLLCGTYIYTERTPAPSVPGAAPRAITVRAHARMQRQSYPRSAQVNYELIFANSIHSHVTEFASANPGITALFRA